MTLFVVKLLSTYLFNPNFAAVNSLLYRCTVSENPYHSDVKYTPIKKADYLIL